MDFITAVSAAFASGALIVPFSMWLSGEDIGGNTSNYILVIGYIILWTVIFTLVFMKIGK